MVHKFTLALAAFIMLAVGCEAERPEQRESSPSEDAPRIGSVELVDSIGWETELNDGVLHRVEVRYDGAVDTVSDVLTSDTPVVVGDTAVLGFDYDQAEIRRGFRYDPGGPVTFQPVPDDVNPVFSRPAIAPDGRHIAYVGNIGRGWSWPAVRAWPGLDPVVVGDTVQTPGSDVSRNRARWLGPDRFEILIDGMGTYHIARGTTGEGVERVDTVGALPAWAQ